MVARLNPDAMAAPFGSYRVTVALGSAQPAFIAGQAGNNVDTLQAAALPGVALVSTQRRAMTKSPSGLRETVRNPR